MNALQFRQGQGMPKISGKEVISDTTEKTLRTLVLVSSIAILTKAYAVPLDKMSFLGVELPKSLLDTTLFVAVVCLLYVYIVKWLGDLAAFRLWFRESSIWSQFGTNMKLDREFVNGGIQLLRDLHAQKMAGMPAYDELPQDKKDDLQNFEKSVELYGVRLNAAGTKFAALSAFGHFYVWVQHFVFPVGLAIFAIYLLLRYGTFLPPARM